MSGPALAAGDLCETYRRGSEQVRALRGWTRSSGSGSSSRCARRPWRARRPDEVSLGEQQRTATARAPVVPPASLVADEPTGRLDEELSVHVLGVLRQACGTAGTGALVAGHDPLVVEHADRVLRLDDGVLRPA